MKNTFCWALAVIGLFSFGVNAQERAAGGAVDAQVTWSALTSQIGGISAKADAVNSRVNQLVLCGKKGMVYAPEVNGRDADGCLVASADMTVINKMLTCNNSGQLWSSAQSKCINAAGTDVVAAPTCSFKTQTFTGPCPKGWSYISTISGQRRTCSDCDEGFYTHFVCGQNVCK